MVLSKQSLKFFMALSFAQTGVLMCVILLSGFYWNKQSEEFRVLAGHIQQLTCNKIKMDEIKSDVKVEMIKQSLRGQGIGVSEEAF